MVDHSHPRRLRPARSPLRGQDADSGTNMEEVRPRILTTSHESYLPFKRGALHELPNANTRRERGKTLVVAFPIEVVGSSSEAKKYWNHGNSTLSARAERGALPPKTKTCTSQNTITCARRARVRVLLRITVVRCCRCRGRLMVPSIVHHTVRIEKKVSVARDASSVLFESIRANILGIGFHEQAVSGSCFRRLSDRT